MTAAYESVNSVKHFDLPSGGEYHPVIEGLKRKKRQRKNLAISAWA